MLVAVGGCVNSSGARPRFVCSSTPVALMTGPRSDRAKAWARSTAAVCSKLDGPSAIACRASSTQTACGRPLTAIALASASTLGGCGCVAIVRSVARHRAGVAESHVVLSVPVVRLDPDMSLPTYAHAGDAGLDLRARVDGVVPAGGGRLLMPTGIAIAIPLGYAGFVLPRSGNALKHGLTLANTPGLIDSAYRGEVQLILLNTDPAEPFVVSRGDRLAQLVIQRVEEVEWDVVDSLEGHDRGGGFGHSGRT